MLVVFGHQSVGQNLLDGIREMASAGPEAPALTSPELLGMDGHGRAIGAFRVGRNGDPDSKLAHFAAIARTATGLRADAILFKFCYVDVHEGTDIAALFDSYRRTMDALLRHRPSRIVGHVTVPLRTLASGTVAQLRRLVGRHHPQLRRNVVRERFNAGLRREYGDTGTLFDLAAIESRDESGRRRVLPGPEGPVPTMCAQYSWDGGHLNEYGRAVVARAFIAYLERLRQSAGSPLPMPHGARL